MREEMRSHSDYVNTESEHDKKIWNNEVHFRDVKFTKKVISWWTFETKLETWK